MVFSKLLLLPAPLRRKLLTASIFAQAESLLADLASHAPSEDESEPIAERTSLPLRLFKFRPINDFAINNLETDTIWLSPASALNDPYDCWLISPALAAAYSDIEDAEAAVEGRFSIYAATARLKIFFREFVWRQVVGTKLDRLQALTGVSSFTTQNSAMNLWAYYGDSHRGLCVEYSPSEFPDEVQSELFPVKYVDAVPSSNIKSSASLIRAALTKSRSWSHENEWRMVRFPIERGQNVFVGKPSAVYLGARVSADNLKRIRGLCKQRKIPCLQMEISPHNFELQPREVTSDSPGGLRGEFSFAFSFGYRASMSSNDSLRAEDAAKAIGRPQTALVPPPSADLLDSGRQEGAHDLH